jgi:hypothetical protein
VGCERQRGRNLEHNSEQKKPISLSMGVALCSINSSKSCCRCGAGVCTAVAVFQIAVMDGCSVTYSGGHNTPGYQRAHLVARQRQRR